MSKLTDKLVTPGKKPQLSPNPDGSGYVAQYEVDSLPLSDIKVNALYILKDGRKFKYDPAHDTWLRVENGPDQVNVDGGRGTPVHENQAPKVRPQVFNNPVAFNGEIFVKGKKLQDYIDSQGGVTEEELQTALQAYLKKTEGAKVWYIPDFPDDITNVSNDMKVGDIIVDVANEIVLTIIQNDQNWFMALGLYATTPSEFVLEKGVDEEFRMDELKAGTKLYTHELVFDNGDSIMRFISFSETPLNAENTWHDVYNLLRLSPKFMYMYDDNGAGTELQNCFATTDGSIMYIYGYEYTGTMFGGSDDSQIYSFDRNIRNFDEDLVEPI